MFGIEEDFKQLMEQVYGPLDGGKMTEIEQIKEQIKVLEKKLSFLEELEQTKSPAEEGYKKVFGYYPVTDVGDAYWEYFQNGYEQAQKDYNVGEHQEPEEEPEELKTLYQMFWNNGWINSCDYLCDIVKEWMFQYDCDDDICKEYLDVLEERLK